MDCICSACAASDPIACADFRSREHGRRVYRRPADEVLVPARCITSAPAAMPHRNTQGQHREAGHFGVPGAARGGLLDQVSVHTPSAQAACCPAQCVAGCRSVSCDKTASGVKLPR